MLWIILTVITVVLSALSTRFFLASLMEGRIYRSSDHNVMALKVGRVYRVFAWGMVTFIMIATLIQLFLQSAHEFLK